MIQYQIANCHSNRPLLPGQKNICSHFKALSICVAFLTNILLRSGNFNSMMSSMTTNATGAGVTTAEATAATTTMSSSSSPPSALTTTASTTPPAAPAYPYSYGAAMYTAAAAAANTPSMSSSIASLRLKAKQVGGDINLTNADSFRY